ncbi:MAG: circularly permuted type 2 ATP-grasp protein [Sphingobium sp.]|nr:circularly permuted type 2 ATP-grasp protein [Sphingobium sp.]
MMQLDNRLQDYPVEVDAGDLFRHASPGVAEKWISVANSLFALSHEAGVPFEELVGRQIQDLGLSFRVAGDADERAWPLTPMPLIIGASEWQEVERGLLQRAQLLEAIAADLYGPQQLVRDGHIPAALVTGSRYFARDMMTRKPPVGPYLQVYAVDLARGPRGQWRVLADRVRLSNGIGYALENRLAFSRSTGSLLSDIHARRLAQFFAELRGGIARQCQRETPRIALLTPGRFNQSYPEQAHLSRYLGFPLVEGRDLSVSDDRLYVRTIAGPKRVDAIWRWIDTQAMDPLRFDARSAIGVPDMFDAWARGGLAMTNWPGVEVLESRAFAAFMPRLCVHMLGEEPILPNTATWWCGQPGEAAQVSEAIDRLIIAPAFGEVVEGLRDTQPVPGAEITGAKRESLFAAMARRPMDYCGQEIVHLSTTPALIGQQFEPRAFTVRAFVARGSDGLWTVMPGGFARLSSSGELRTSLMGDGDMSADVCIVDDMPDPGARALQLSSNPAIRRGGGILASQAADNLFWFGRYSERAEMTVRVIRSTLGNSIDADAITARDPEVRRLLVDMLQLWSAIGPESAALSASQACRAALVESDLPGGVAGLLDMIRQVGLSLRDRFAPDFWRIASRPLPEVTAHRSSALLRVTRELIERFSAMSGLIAEDMVRSHAWRFLDLGRRIERALSISRMARQLAQAQDQSDALSALLDLCDSQITYRSRYLTGALRNPVYDLVLLDPDNPRSLAFQVQLIHQHLSILPALGDDQLPEAPLLAARAVMGPLVSQAAPTIDDHVLWDIENRLLALSEAISTRYFLQFERTDPALESSLLA